MSSVKNFFNDYILPLRQNPSSTSDNFPGNLTREQLKENGFLETRAGLDPRNDLDYPIQSTFTQWRPNANYDDDSHLSAADVVVLLPIWRLASAFFNSPASVRFVHAILYGPRDKNGYKNYRGNATEGAATAKWSDLALGDELHPSRISLFSIRREVALGMQCLDNYIWWGLVPPSSTESNPYYAAYTQRVGKVSLRGEEALYREGSGSRITLNRDVHQTLLDLHAQKDQTPDVLNSILRLQFRIATLMCHELCHAVQNAVTTKMANGEDEPEPYWKSQSLNELGHAWENEVFGGVITTDEGDAVSGPIRVNKWPSEQAYDDSFRKIHARRSPKKVSSYYYVPMDWIANVQKQRNWDLVIIENFRYDETLLYIPKQIGYRKASGWRTSDPLWSQAQSSDGECESDSEHRVLRVGLVSAKC